MALRTIDGQEHAIFREACEALKLLESDHYWDETMEEVVQYRTPTKIRDLYAKSLFEYTKELYPEVLNKAIVKVIY